MIKSKIENKCIFCRYWEGNKAVRSRQPKYWEFDDETANCIKKRGTKFHAIAHCPYFELDAYTYFD